MQRNPRRQTRIQAKVWSQTGPDSQERKSEQKNMSDEGGRFQRQEVMPKAGASLLPSISFLL